jgi:hypothetical protein
MDVTGTIAPRTQLTVYRTGTVLRNDLGAHEGQGRRPSRRWTSGDGRKARRADTAKAPRSRSGFFALVAPWRYQLKAALVNDCQAFSLGNSKKASVGGDDRIDDAFGSQIQSHGEQKKGSGRVVASSSVALRSKPELPLFLLLLRFPRKLQALLRSQLS